MHTVLQCNAWLCVTATLSGLLAISSQVSGLTQQRLMVHTDPGQLLKYAVAVRVC
jgi:hypothetical protein